MILVTGGAGFIGSNLVRKLNKIGIQDIIIMDNLENGKKVFNLNAATFCDYIDYQDWYEGKSLIDFSKIEVIFHLGACSATTNWDGKFLMKYNYEFSKLLYQAAQNHDISFIYASSASVYGLGANGFLERPECERPINPYAFSKLAFDNYVRLNSSDHRSQVVGLRYFNVYGINEFHKTDMKSPVLKFYEQILENNSCKVFQGYNGGSMDENVRDFVSVDDCISVNCWFMENPQISGIFNVGSGQVASFLDVAKLVAAQFSNEDNLMDYVEMVPFPQHLKGAYQSYTCADINYLRSVGYCEDFSGIKDGIANYIRQLKEH